MMKASLYLATVLLASLFSSSVPAQSLQYLGPHTTNLPGDGVTGGEGVLVYNELCAAAFDGSQMCESIDILRSGSPEFPASSPVFQWVKPTIVSVVLNGNGEVLYVDASGQIAFLEPNGVFGFSCGGWATSTNSRGGLAVSTRGEYGAFPCNLLLAVACCKVASGKK